MNTRLFGDPETGGKVYIADPDLLKPGANLEDLQGQFLVNIEDEYDPLFPETVAEMNFAAWEHAMLTYMADQNSLGTNDPRLVDPWIATSGAVTVAPDYKRVGFSDPGYVALVKPDDWGETYQSAFGLKKEGPLAVDLSRANMEGEFFYKGGIYHELGHALFPIADAKKALAAQLEDPVFMEHPDLKVAYINNYVERVADTVEALMHLEDSSETAPQIAVFSDIRAYSTFHRQNNHPAEEERHPLRHNTSNTLNMLLGDAQSLGSELKNTPHGFADFRRMALSYANRTHPSPQEFLEQSLAHESLQQDRVHHGHEHGDESSPAGAERVLRIDSDTISIHGALSPESSRGGQAGSSLVCSFKEAIERLTAEHNAPGVYNTPDYTELCSGQNGRGPDSTPPSSQFSGV
ncbi:MAG: hypothetical protein H6857_01890 [Rhodospirillales bacterium]|nr:hypothetical protein [Rhodospirillales bacterium]